MMIKNYEQLATTKIRKDVLDILKAGLEKVSPENLMRATVKYNKEFNSVIVHNQSCDLFGGRIFVIGGGKAVGAMAETLEDIIGAENITAGVVCANTSEFKTKKIEIIEAGLPLPDTRGIKGVEKMLALKESYGINEKDLVVCLLSGGGSALLSSPASDFSIKDQQAATKILIKCGAGIDEVNIIRKHLSKIKGGRLARYFYPAKVLSMIISDVPGNNLETIASGPTVADPSTYLDAYNVLVKYDLLDKIPASIKNHILRGCEGKEEESPKQLSNVANYIIGDAAAALEEMARQAKIFGYKPIIAETKVIGDPIKAVEKITNGIKAGDYEGYEVLLFAGETSPATLTSRGRGGSNQYFAALNMLALEDFGKDWAMASLDSDGFDYIPEAAGAIVDGSTLKLAEAKGVDAIAYVKDYNVYNLFKKTGANLIVTGPTGTNVADLMVYIINK